jgi:hypothetical protein
MVTSPMPLRFSNPAQSAPSPVTVQMSIQGELLVAQFQVAAEEIFAKKDLGPTNYPYEFDVVELFVTCSDASKPPYFEYEVSPFNQSLQVNVITPRQEYYFGVKNGFTHSAALTERGWQAEMRIPLMNIGWHGSGHEIRGNAYAALGQGEKRAYWSLFELPPGKPDFHVPAAFKKFF